MPSRKEGAGMAPFGSFLKMCVTNVWQRHLPPLPRAQGMSSGAVARALNKNVCPIKCMRGALPPGAAAPASHGEINKSPRNAPQTCGEVYGPHNAR